MSLTPETRPDHTPLYFLGGPTASGKTELAHRLADRHGFALLSLDAMMVYRGMDVGTAKPTSEEIRRYRYAGLNLANPGECFSTGLWLESVRTQMDGRPRIAVGGTGLYLLALFRGLVAEPRGTARGTEEDVEALRDEIRIHDPAALDSLADPWNPRRLARALDFLRAGKPLPGAWSRAPKPVLPVLSLPVPKLDARIRRRAADMLAGGLLEEAAALRKQHGELQGTAAQAIGYREAREVLDGKLGRAEAVEAITLRTRRYAKRQRTWFRNQTDARWIDVESGDPETRALEIEKVWTQTGPLYFNRRKPA